MRNRFPWAVLAISGVILVGCDKCSSGKETAATTAATSAPATTPTDAAAPATPQPAAAPAAAPGAAPAAAPADPGNGQLQITDVTVGTGAEAVDGKKVSVQYTGTLLDGTKFDSTKDRGTPFTFVLGSGMVIAGWDQGVKGMKEGGTRKLVIPPNLAYGNRAVGGVIPPNSTLVFDIELVKVE